MLTDYDLGNFNEIDFYKSLIEKFKKVYPDIDPISLDSDLLENMLTNIFQDDKSKYTESMNNIKPINKITNIIKENILMADELIPEMSIPTNLIYLEGKINNTPINIMIDTGATSCFTYKSIVEKCGVEYLIDSTTTTLVQGAHGIKPTLGVIWFLEIDLYISNGNSEFVSIPISVDIIDDGDINESYKNIIENNKCENNKCENKLVEKEIPDSKNNKNKLELILGINFLKSYRANIDFSSMTITLNKTIKIKFK